MSLQIETADLVGPFRSPHNTARQAAGSIHDDATATKLGFKGGTVAGSLHMDQFMPQLVEIYGADWWRKGNLSSYFRQATIHGEAVRVIVRKASRIPMPGWRTRPATSSTRARRAAPAPILIPSSPTA